MAFNDELAEKLKLLIGEKPKNFSAIESPASTPNYFGTMPPPSPVAPSAPAAPEVVPPTAENIQASAKALNAAPPEAQEAIKTNFRVALSGMGLGEVGNLKDSYLKKAETRAGALRAERKALSEQADKLFEEASKSGKTSRDEAIGTLLLTALPTIMGGLVGGKLGIVAGGNVGAATGKEEIARQEKERSETRKAALDRASKLTDQQKDLLKEEGSALSDADKAALELDKLGLELPAKLQMAEAKTSLAGTAAQARAEDRRSRELQKRVEGIAKDAEPTMSMLQSVAEMEKVIQRTNPAFSFNDFDERRKQLVTGEGINLPGRNIPGIGRISFYSGDARELEAVAAQVFNKTLLERSGAAVTEPELRRLQEEFSRGKFNTEGELLAAMKRYQRGLQKHLDRVAQKYGPDAVNVFQSRPGFEGAANASEAIPQAANLEELSIEELRELAGE